MCLLNMCIRQAGRHELINVVYSRIYVKCGVARYIILNVFSQIVMQDFP
jgi:hypothetical protein